MTTITISDSFNLSSNECTILVINIEKGAVEKGMGFSIQERNFKVLGVEHIDGNINGEWVSKIALKIEKVEELDIFTNVVGNLIHLEYLEKENEC